MTIIRPGYASDSQAIEAIGTRLWGDYWPHVVHSPIAIAVVLCKDSDLPPIAFGFVYLYPWHDGIAATGYTFGKVDSHRDQIRKALRSKARAAGASISLIDGNVRVMKNAHSLSGQDQIGRRRA